jgi:energy-coupling factor transporter ATP-binding protein EcfA2
LVLLEGEGALNPRLQKLASDWKTYVVLLAAAGTAISTLSATVSGVGDAVKIFKDLPPEALWALAGVFLVIAILALASALSRHSILREPQQFLLSPENPQHLAGREEEVRKLAGQCARHAMVFLTGDSGSGKSSLVRAGLVPALEDSELIPLVVDLSGVGWGRSLSLALARGLGRLPEDQWLALGSGDRPAIADLFAWMGKRPLHSPRRLLIVFDQFDDYLAAHRHRQQFYDGTTLRRSTELESRNPDWHGLADLLRSGAVRVLVVARSEASPSLPALGFVEKAGIAYEHLTRLPGNLVAPLLSRLTEPLGEGRPVVEDPELGWLQLRSRLLRDLEASGEGQILPIQLSVALNSLRLLRSLTTAEYERIGGLRGLERLHVERHAKTAAEAAGVRIGAVLEALLTMASPDGSKTQPAARSDFDAILSRHGAAPDATERTVRQLEDDKLLRGIPGEQDEAETLLLFHDYLARGVREAYRQANRWTELLRERAQIFQESVSWRQRWRALLSPVEQIRLLWERLRGRFSFNDKRRFFGLSAVRWVPVGLTLLVLGVGGWAADRSRKHEIAAQVMKAIGHSNPLSEEEAQELRYLRAAGYSAALEALHLACQDGPTAARASRRLEQLVSMAIGLDPTGMRSSQLAEELILPTLENAQVDPESVVFAADMASRLHLAPSVAKQVAGSIVSRMATETNSPVLANLGEALGSLSAKLERQDVVPGAEILVTRMKTESAAGTLAHLGEALGSLSAKLERKEVVPAAEMLVSRMKTETDELFLPMFGAALGSLSAKLERNDVLPGAEILVSRMKTTANPLLRPQLARVLGSLSAKLELQDVVPAAEILAFLMKDQDISLLSFSGGAIGSFSSKLDRQDVVPLAESLVSRMKTETDCFNLVSLGRALGYLSEKLERQDVIPAAEILVSCMETETIPLALVSLSETLGSLSAKLERQDVLPAAELLVSQMNTATEAHVLERLGSVFASLSAKLERQDAVPLAGILVSRMKTETNADALASLALALASLSAKLDRKDIAPALDILVVRMSREWNGAWLARLTATAVAFGPSLPSHVSPSANSEPVRVEQVYVDLLKSPFVVGQARSQLLAGLEKATGQSFADNLWNFVDWATKTPEGRALGLDLDGPPPSGARPSGV